MARVAFSLTVRPELIDEYIARHSPVWPEMLAEIAAAGRRNYSLFLDRSTATLFGYYETDDDAAAQAYLASSEVAARWEASPRASRCTSRGTRSTTTARCAATPKTSASPSARSTPTPSRTRTTSSAPSRTTMRRSARRRSITTSSASTSWMPRARMFSIVSAEATYPGHEAHDWLQNRYASVTATYSALIAHDVAAGRLTTYGDPLELAGLVVTGWEGIQIRWLADGTDPVAAMGALLSAVLRPAPAA